jgi:hypothetical protein
VGFKPDHRRHCTLQVMHAIGIAGTRLSFDREKSELSHSAYLELAEACMSIDPADRPPFRTMHIVRGFCICPCTTTAAQGGTSSSV